MKPTKRLSAILEDLFQDISPSGGMMYLFEWHRTDHWWGHQINVLATVRGTLDRQILAEQ